RLPGGPVTADGGAERDEPVPAQLRVARQLGLFARLRAATDAAAAGGAPDPARRLRAVPPRDFLRRLGAAGARPDGPGVVRGVLAARLLRGALAAPLRASAGGGRPAWGAEDAGPGGERGDPAPR